MEDKLLLNLLQKNARMKITDLAAALDESKDHVIERLTELEKEKVICGYHTIVNWDRTNNEIVTALIEINAKPERDYGYDRIASHIYKFEEVDTMYLLSGSFDFVAVVKGRTMQEVAYFVASKLASIEGVTGTQTYFVLKQYKNNGTILIEDEEDKNDRLVVLA
ncbi:MAG: Lrp/AsnC family transcriptional regulator [Erysipelotrichaceae bacterium]|nr:Lrp/AsnC family transcriptional regulator [Erysipelotrichaceae bacterium]